MSSKNRKLKKQEKVTVNIIGGCVSRNIFNVERGKKYEVGTYIFRNSLSTLLYDVDDKYKIEQSELPDSGESNFEKRMICTAINADAQEQLSNRKGDWIIIDTIYCSGPCAIIKYSAGNERLIQTNTSIMKIVKTIFEINPKFKQCQFNLIDANVNMAYYVSRIAEYLKNNWGKNIILINVPNAFVKIDRNGDIRKDPQLYIMDDQNRNNMAKLLLNHLDCHYIEMPSVVLRDAWYNDSGTNNHPMHYNSEIYDYLKETVDAITSEEEYIHQTLKKIKAKYDVKIGNILLGVWASERHTIRRVNAIIRDEGSDIDKDRMINDLKELIDRESSEAYGALARLYRTGTYFGKDLNKAAEWMRKAAEGNVGWAKNELFDILWHIGTPESHKEMISIATEFAKEGDGGAMIRIGRAYREGKGFEKDQKQALEWMFKASEKTWQFGRELVDNLLRSTKEEHHKEAFKVCLRLTKERNDAQIMGRLARIYRDGKGVDKDLDLAAEWMRKAADGNVGWAKNELFDILSKKNNNDKIDTDKKHVLYDVSHYSLN